MSTGCSVRRVRIIVSQTQSFKEHRPAVWTAVNIPSLLSGKRTWSSLDRIDWSLTLDPASIKLQAFTKSWTVKESLEVLWIYKFSLLVSKTKSTRRLSMRNRCQYQERGLLISRLQATGYLRRRTRQRGNRRHKALWKLYSKWTTGRVRLMLMQPSLSVSCRRRNCESACKNEKSCIKCRRSKRRRIPIKLKIQTLSLPKPILSTKLLSSVLYSTSNRW